MTSKYYKEKDKTNRDGKENNSAFVHKLSCLSILSGDTASREAGIIG